MKKIFFYALIASFALSACQKIQSGGNKGALAKEDSAVAYTDQNAHKSTFEQDSLKAKINTVSVKTE